MTIAPSDLRAMLDLETIMAADILVCSRSSAGGGVGGVGGSTGSRVRLLDCLIGQKKRLPTQTAKSLPMGVIVEIGRALDIETRMNLMLANKLFMEAFAIDERDAIRREYAAHLLKNMWYTLLGKASDKNYSMFFEFEDALRVDILPGKIRFVVNIENANSLSNVFPTAHGIADEVDDEYIIGIKLAERDDFGNNEATAGAIVDAIRQLSAGLTMLPPIAYAGNPTWLQKVKRLMGFNNPYQPLSLQPIFDKLAMYHISALPQSPRDDKAQAEQQAQQTKQAQPNTRNTRRRYLTTSQAIASAKNGTIIKRIRQLNA